MKITYLFIATTMIFFFANDTSHVSFANSSYEKTKIAGKIKNHDNNSPLPFTNIYIPDLNIGTTSDSTGHYHLTVPEGDFEIIFSHIGYLTKKHTYSFDQNEKTHILNIVLKPSVIIGSNIEITAQSLESIETQYVIPPEKFRNIANPLPDPLISLKTLPGVSSGNDQSSFYNVRGGNYDENLIYLNGIELYQPLLVRKGIAENPSLINPYFVENINLRTGSFPVYYGDKLSSILDIKYRDQNDRHFSGMARLSTVQAEFALEGTASTKFHWFIGIRKISYGYLLQSQHIKGDYTPNYFDIQCGASWRPNFNDEVQLFLLRSDSRYSLEPNIWIINSSMSEIQNLNIQGHESFCYDVSILGLRWYREYNDKFHTQIQISYLTQNEAEKTRNEYYYMNNPEPGDTTTPYLDPSVVSQYLHPLRVETFDNQLQFDQFQVALDCEYRLPKNQHLRFGLTWKQFNAKDRLAETIKDSTLGQTSLDQNLPPDFTLDNQGIAAYIEYKRHLWAKLRLQIGMRLIHYKLNKEAILMPRLSLNYELTNRFDLSISVGRFSQPPLYKEFRSRYQTNANHLKAQKSWHIMFGTEYRWTDLLLFKTEIYYKQLTDLISYELFDVRLIYSGNNDAIGYAYGLDVYLRTRLLTDCLGWISYSYLVARENLLNDSENWVPRPTDQRHTLALTLEDKMERLPGSRMHMRILFGSGYPYTFYQAMQLEQDSNKLVSQGRNSFRIRYYKRFDIGFTQQFRLFNSIDITTREEVFNLFNEYNILGYTWIAGKRVEHGLSRRTYNVGFEVHF